MYIYICSKFTCIFWSVLESYTAPFFRRVGKQRLYKIEFFCNKDDGKSSKGESYHPPIFWANDRKIRLLYLLKKTSLHAKM